MRFASLCGFGAALLCAAFLVACGGGGGSAPGGGGSLTGSHATTGKGSGSTMTIVVHRGHTKRTAPTATHTYTKKNGQQMRLQSVVSRRPKYISDEAYGLQVTISTGNGGPSQTVYADISQGSVLCTPPSGDVSSCTIAIPTLGTNEQFTILETDNTPQNDTNGYGTGFATNTNIMGAVQQTQTIQLGTQNNVAMSINPVAAYVFDCSFPYEYYGVPHPFGQPVPYSTNFGVDPSGVNENGQARIVVTAGVAAAGAVVPVFNPADGDCYDPDTNSAPFVDVNASPEPITFTGGSGVSLVPIINNGTPPPAAAYTSSGSIPNDGYIWDDCFFLVGVKVASSVSSPQPLPVSNNLTALNPFLSPPSSYASTYTYTVVPLSVSSYSVSVNANNSTTITASDYGAEESGTDAESAWGANVFTIYYTGTLDPDESCNNSSGTELANVYSTGSLSTTTGQQTIEIDAGSTTGTCTFYVLDVYSGVVTQPITVTIN